MFDGGVPEQIHRFVASPPPPPPLPPHQQAAERSLPFPVSFASSYTNHQAQHMLSLDSRKINIHHHHHHHHHDIKDCGATSEWMSHTEDQDGDNHRHHHHHPWCSDEVLALLRFRSTVENWFPEFTWEHTSRKLAEIGFKRSPQECKEKFEEEERRYLNTNNNNNNDHHISNYNNKGNYKIFSEVEEFYHHGHDDENVSSEVGDNQTKRNDSLEGKGNVEETGRDLLEDDKRDHQGQAEEVSTENKVISIDNAVKVGNAEDHDAKSSSSSSLMMIMRDKKKRKKKKEKERFGVLKGFCEGLVRNMIAQQEEMHKKLLEDMMKKEEEKMAREEAWKKQEMERLNKEVEIREQEQAMASDRNTNIIKFISKFTDHDHHDDSHYKVQSPSPSQDSSLLALPQTQSKRKFQTSSSPLSQTLTQHISLEPISAKALKTKTQNPKPPKSDEKSDLGKRWPRDEVLALINIRRSISSTNDDDLHKEGSSLSSSSSSSKAVPLWERISKKMLETGYKRSAKRCKEKWENINKYFRKTKDVNKKRPLDSRTCPYFHQLTALYSQPCTGTTATTTTTATSAGDLETRPEESRVGSGDLDLPAAVHVDGDSADDEKSNVQFSGFDREF